MLQVDSITKSFGSKQVLRGVSFTARDSEVFGLLASNGGGKTTLMRIALGLLPADAGVARIRRRTVVSAPVRGVGYMPEERGLYDDDTVIAQLKYLGKLQKVPVAQLSHNIEELLHKLGIEEYADTRLKKLSLGNQQRVQIAAALIHKPQLLVLDEPFSGLDPLAVEKFSALITDHAASGGTVIFSSHQLEVVERICDRVGIMKDGKIVFEGTLADLTASNNAITVEVHARLDSPQGAEVLDWSRCPSVAEVRKITNNGPAGEDWIFSLSLVPTVESIRVDEILKSGLKSEEILGISKKDYSLLDVFSSVFSPQS